MGGAGLVGSHLALRLLDEGCRVTVIDIRTPRSIALLGEMQRYPHFSYLRHDLTHPIHSPCDEIYNLTSSLSLRHHHLEAATILRTEMLCAINALELARHNHARLLYASSGSIYNSLCGITATTLQPDREMITTFAETKLAVEALHRAYIRQYDCDIRIMRIFNTYGTGASLDDNRVVCSMIRRALSSDNIIIFGSGDQIRTFCWAGDVAEAMDRWMQMGRVECGTIALDIGGHYEISILQLANLIVELTGSSSQVVHCDSRYHDYRRKVPDLMLAHRLLGWLPSMPLSDGLTLTINDMRHRMQAQARQLSWIDIQ